MNKKGLVFNDAFMALIIGGLVVIMMVSGVAFAYDDLLCYTGAKFILESPAAHIGTALNSKVTITDYGLYTETYSGCAQECSDKKELCEDPDDTGDDVLTCNEQKTACETNCKNNYDKSNPGNIYHHFLIKIKYNGQTDSKVKVDLIQNSKELWSEETHTLERGDIITLDSKPFSTTLGICSILINAKAIDKKGITPDSELVDLEFCLK